MQYDDQLGSNVLNQIRSLPFWRDFEDRVAVAITGSVGAGMGDVHSDLDGMNHFREDYIKKNDYPTLP